MTGLRSHCRKGHPLIGDNVLVGRKGERRCALCRSASRGAQLGRRNIVQDGEPELNQVPRWYVLFFGMLVGFILGVLR
jgi:hypothetical protein